MNLLEKPLAPKPISKCSPLSKLKLPRSGVKFNTQPASMKGMKTKTIQLIQQNTNVTKSLSPNPKCPFVKVSYTQFEAELEKEISDNYAKSEILSILCIRDSSSTYFKSSLFSNSEKFNDRISEIPIDDNAQANQCNGEMRTPERVTNPFIKNFAEEVDDYNRDINFCKKSKSSNVLTNTDEWKIS